MPKQIKADIEQVVEAVYRRLDGNDLSSTMLDLAIRTALEQFVVESKDAEMDSLEKIIEEIKKDMTDLLNIQTKGQFVKTAKYASLIVLHKYLTRLKALRELTDKKEEDEEAESK
jgi:hypothetical protein